jgi:NAD(P)-dependent dehydrogenase (short-subunit alcohol dehydrogenase family)
MSLADRILIVTGGAKGIGRACARRAAEQGARLVIGDIDEEAGRRTVADITAAGGAAVFCACDVGERLDVHNLVAVALDAYGRVDGLINSASVLAPAGFLDADEAVLDEALRVNLKGAFFTGQAVARQMVHQRDEAIRAGEEISGYYAIVNISALDAVMAVPELVPFAVSKGGLNQLTKAMAVALAPHGIRVNAVGPGTVRAALEGAPLTGRDPQAAALLRTPLGRIAEPDEIAAIALFLISDAASYVTGQCLYADGGRLALNDVMPSSA